MALGALGSVRYVGRNSGGAGPRLGRFRLGELAARKTTLGAAQLGPTSISTLRRFGARGVSGPGRTFLPGSATLGRGGRFVRPPAPLAMRRRFRGLESHPGAHWDPSLPEPIRTPPPRAKRKGKSRKPGRAVKCKMVCMKGGKKRRMCWDKNGVLTRVPKKRRK